ncbi:hypothetical protein ABZ897_49850 [Nonomuraea sp. NPDC046802]
MRRALTLAEIQQLPAVVDVVTAGRALGLGRNVLHLELPDRTATRPGR